MINFDDYRKKREELDELEHEASNYFVKRIIGIGNCLKNKTILGIPYFEFEDSEKNSKYRLKREHSKFLYNMLFNAIAEDIFKNDIAIYHFYVYEDGINVRTGVCYMEYEFWFDKKWLNMSDEEIANSIIDMATDDFIKQEREAEEIFAAQYANLIESKMNIEKLKSDPEYQNYLKLRDKYKEIDVW